MTRILKALIRLYPPRHRQLYETEMLAAALHRWSRAGRTQSVITSARLSIFWDLAAGAVGVWKDSIARGTTGMGSGWGLDVRYELRSLWKSRGYVITAVVVLACAVAVNAAVYSYVQGTLLYEPPYEDPDSVVVVWGSNTVNGQLRDVVSGPNYIDIQEQVRTLEMVAAFHSDGAYLVVDGRPEVLEALEVTADFFRLLGVEPALGRVFGEEDRASGAPENLVVTHAFWRDRLGSDPSVIGTMMNFERAPKTVIGVLPEGFEFITPAPLFTPLRDDVLAADPRTRIHFNVLGRLAPDAAVPEANAELNAIMSRIIDQYPRYEGWSFLAEPLHAVSIESVRPVIRVLSATALLVLLVALVNLATLFRIRAHSRAGELSVRAALGAGKFRLARLVVIETGGLAAVGAAAGLLATPILLERVAAMLPAAVAIPESAARVPVLRALLDPTVMAVAFGSAVLGALALTIPSFLLTLRERSLAAGARSRAHGGIRGTRLLVGVELAVATVLCVGAGLTARSASHLLATDVGVESDGLLTLYFGDVWGLPVGERVAYIRKVAEEVERLPGVQRAGVIDYVAFQAEDDFARVYFLDRALEPLRDLREEWRRVDAGLFDAAGMTIVAGRSFERADTIGKVRAAVINEAFAAKHYPGRDPVGEYLSTHEEAYRDMEIVGVVADVRSLGPASPAPPMLYVPFQGLPRGRQGLYVRVAGEPSAHAERIQEAIWSVDSSQPIDGITRMSELVGAWIAIPRATRALVSSLAALAWLLSAVGVFGVVAFAVRIRRTELGIRMALGASPGRVRAEQLRAISPVVFLGIGAGLLAAVFAARAAQAVLFGVSPVDVPSLVGAFAAMAAAVSIATYVPARRASRIDPSEVIRAE